MMESHIHIDYETDDELQDYLESCGTVDTATGAKVIYTKVPEGQGTSSQFDALFGPLLDILCDCDLDVEELDGSEKDRIGGEER